jgi:hypothetical protein
VLVHESGAGGLPVNCQRARRFALAILLAGAALPAEMAIAGTTQPQPEDPSRDIVVTAPLFHDIQPERQLDQEAIESYGVSTIDELLGEVQVELGEDAEQPLIIVNGQRIHDLSEIGAFPVEILKSLEVLPRGSAVALGGRPGQRVISLNLQSQARSATLTGAHKVATEGDWDSDRGEAILTRVRGASRANITLRARDDSALLESERGILQPEPRYPYSLGGNIVGYPGTGVEIDPLLSALAGQIVTVAPLPGSATPTLADFVAGANQPAITDLGDYRTVRPQTRNYDLNATYATPLAPWLTANATLRLNRNVSKSLRGLPGELFAISASNPFSPFSRAVGLALYGPDPLRSRSVRQGGQGNLTLNATFGNWTATWNANRQQSKSVTNSERQTSSTMQLGNELNPFSADLAGLNTLRTDRFASRTISTASEITANGPVTQLPAGPLMATIEGRLDWDRQRSSSSFGAIEDSRRFNRSEQSIRGAVSIPLASPTGGFVTGIGALDANLEYGRQHYSDAGSVSHYAYELNWEPAPLFRMTGSVDSTQTPATVDFLGGPITTIADVRVFDPLTGDTVDVTQITGGNPDLLPQKTKIRRLNALFRLVPKLKLQLNAEYTDTDRRNFVSSLPEASAAVALAFPDRYIRDSNGVLVTEDLRPVNFDSERDKRLRWGLSMNIKLGGTPAAPTVRKAGERRPPSRPAPYFQLTANHTMVFSDKIVIRSGLDPVDLLSGGAIGIASGRTRHQVDGTAAITAGGTGARIGVTWRGKSELESRINGIEDTIHFSPLLLVNIRAFTDMKRFFPDSAWAKGLRLSLDVVNATNHRQRVRDSFGDTPRQYQPGYRDPLGRTIEIELRKVF